MLVTAPPSRMLYFPMRLNVDAAERPRVLIVDDERIIADTLVKIFSKSGYDARGVYSAEEALALIPVWTPNWRLSMSICLQ